MYIITKRVFLKECWICESDITICFWFVIVQCGTLIFEDLRIVCENLDQAYSLAFFKWCLHWFLFQVVQDIKSNQITFIVTSPQHKCLGEWNSYERAPDSAKNKTKTKNNNLNMDSTYLHHSSLLHFCHYGFVVVKLFFFFFDGPCYLAAGLRHLLLAWGAGEGWNPLIYWHCFIFCTDLSCWVHTQMIKHLQMHVPAHAHNPTHIWTVNLWHSRVCTGVCSGQALI